MWKEIWRGEKDNHVKGNQPAKGMEVWQETNPEQETMEKLFGDRDLVYKGAEECDGFSLCG